MKILLDTHILLWTLKDMLPNKVSHYFKGGNYKLYFSPISIYEVVIKSLKGLPDFNVNPVSFHNDLLLAGFKELKLTSNHSLMVRDMPLLHHDPFDRILLAQAHYERISLLTSDKILAKYPGPIIYVG